MVSVTFKLPGVVLITGAAGTGIGAAVAKVFAHSGCSRFAITDIKSLSSTSAALLEINPQAQILSRQGDISDESFVNSLAADVKRIFGRLDYVVNCAGVLGDALRSHETPLSAYERIMNINLKGTWLASRAALGIMVAQEAVDHPGQRGAIVNIASQLGVVAKPATTPYCASKAAIINMTRSDAIDYSRDGIRINCVCSGLVATQMTTGTPESTVNIAPMGRMGRPSEIADAVLFLCSSQSSFVQGHALVVDGGYTIN
ncbi:oxidoreductase [Nemania serpens]|nr:oxidoreductase [Nemania serpens]